MNHKEIAESKAGYDIGKNNGIYYVLLPCEKCGERRWVNIHHRNKLCQRCSHSKHGIQMIGKWTGSKHGSWRGGRLKIKGSYILIWVEKTSPFACMINQRGYILEHRLVVAQYLHRPLKSWEIVHHKNGVKDDNRLENLELLPKYSHDQITKIEMEMERLKKRITLLEAENILLASNRIEDVVRVEISKA